MVVAENLVKEFTKSEKKGRKTVKTRFRAVDGISLTANNGETLGIIGPNGAGKTTLLRMLGKLMEPTEGCVRHFLSDGTELQDAVDVKKTMGYLSNNTKLYERLSVRELLSVMGDVYGLSKEETEERISCVTEELGMAAFLDNPAGKLSTGQTQRGGLARCMFADPQLYILDEPTLGLDIMSAAGVVEFMTKEKEKGKTIIYSTHYLEEAEKLCDRVILINRGQVLAEGSPAELCGRTGEKSLREAFLKLIDEAESEEPEDNITEDNTAADGPSDTEAAGEVQS